MIEVGYHILLHVPTALGGLPTTQGLLPFSSTIINQHWALIHVTLPSDQVHVFLGKYPGCGCEDRYRLVKVCELAEPIAPRV